MAPARPAPESEWGGGGTGPARPAGGREPLGGAGRVCRAGVPGGGAGRPPGRRVSVPGVRLSAGPPVRRAAPLLGSERQRGPQPGADVGGP